MRRAAPVLVAVAVAVAVALPSAHLATAARALRADIRPLPDERVVTILVVGSDIGPPGRPGNPLEGNADAIHLVAVDTKRLRATIVDVPRDSLIGGTKVNAHLASGGPGRLKSVLSDYTGVDIDHYALTTFDGFRDLVNALGGLKIDLERPLRDAAAKADLRGGRQWLDGTEALAYSRARKTLPDGDFDRTRHQGRLLRLGHRRLRAEVRDLPSLTRLVAAFARNTETDIPPAKLLRLATLATRIKPGQVRQDALSGSLAFSSAGSIVHLRSGDAFSRIRNGKIGP